MEIYVLIKGDAIELLAEKILEMDEQGCLVKTVIGSDDIFFLFDATLDVTFVRFSGQSWALPAAGFLDYLERKTIPFTVDANKPVPYVLTRQPSEEILKQGSKIKMPPMGNIDRVIDYANRIHNEQTVKEVAEALEELPTND